MEIVGSSVAISQILEKVASFYILYSEAPGAIQNVRDKLGFIALHNSVIQQIVEDSAYHELSINQEQMKLLTACLYSALETLESVHEECEKIVSKASKRRSGRLTFAAWDHKRAEEILRRLNGCESSLNSAITLLRFQVESKQRLKEREADRRIIDELKPYINLQVHLAATEAGPSTSSPTASSVVVRTSAKNNSRRSSFRWRLVTPASWQRKGGVRGEIVRIDRTNEGSTLFRVALQMQVPSSSGWNLVSISVFAIVTLPRLWQNFDLGARLRYRNIVPDDAPIVQACKLGNVELVQTLLQNGHASVRDVTKDLFPLLSFAITSRRPEMVKFLLDKGADATELFGVYHSDLLSIAYSLRQVEIARLLLQANADPHHVSAASTTPMYHLFDKKWASAANIEFLEILIAENFKDINVQSNDGFSALHHAARHGQASDIRSLLRYDASLELRNRSWGWTPAFAAAFYDNADTLKELIWVQPEVVNDVDYRGWTLLHVASSNGSLESMSVLVDAGANAQVYSLPGQSLVPDDLRGRELSPVDVARHHGEKTLEALLGMLSEKEKTLCSVSEDGELFWDARMRFRDSFS